MSRRAGGPGLTGQGLRFALVGSAATALQLGLYAFLSGSVGAQLANICSWLVATLLANAAHQKYTFRVTGNGGESVHLVACDEVGRRLPTPGASLASFSRQAPVGLLTSLAGLGLSSIVLAVLDQPTGLAGTVALVVVNAGVGALRFLTLRWWMVGRRVAAALSAPRLITTSGVA